MEYHLEPISVSGDEGDSSPAPGAIWLDGDVLSCACPDCGAPMSIRLWLLVADCFRCGTSIELSEEQEREAYRLLREQEEAKRADSKAAVAAISPTVARTPKRTQPAPEPKAKADTGAPAPQQRAAPAKAPASSPPPRSRPRRVAASEVHRGARARVHEIYEKGGIAILLASFFNDLPAWLVSALVHLVLILLLGLWVIGEESPDLDLTLATSVSEDDLEGELGEIEETPEEAFDFEDPGSVEFVSPLEETGETDQEEVEFEQVEIPLKVDDPVGDIPQSTLERSPVMPNVEIGRMFAGRDPKARAQVVKSAGGTSETEAAVARGLKWLARHQNADGSWSLHEFHKAPGADGKIDGRGRQRNDMAATALALLPFLGAGQTPFEGEYSNVVRQGLEWMLTNQAEDGDCRYVHSGNTGMYAHGQATIVLCETYALTGDEQFREPAQRAINFIVRAQHPAGGWRYRPGEAGDLSVVGWQLMALQVARNGGYLHVPQKTLELAGAFLDEVQKDKDGGRYAYQRGRGPTETMTAEALLCRQYLGWPKNHPGLQDGVEYLLEEHPPAENRPNIYYWYYATQVLHHFGGTSWRKWNAKMRDVLVSTQEEHGPAAGSWAPRGDFASDGGRIYMTSLAICSLEVYYRYMTLYEHGILGDLDDLQ